MAVHVGSAHRRDDDWFGLSLSRCARLVDAAHGGQVVLSGAAAALLTESPVDEVGLMDLGRVELRDLAGPEHVWQVTAPGLAVEFPALRHGPLTAGNLPAEASKLIGRTAEIEQVGADLAEARLVVLTGAGGVGKTRLALAAAAAVGAAFSAGVWLVELAAGRRSGRRGPSRGDRVAVRSPCRLVGPGVDHRRDRRPRTAAGARQLRTSSRRRRRLRP